MPYDGCGIAGDTLMVRIGPDAYDEALQQAHVKEMDFTGRPLKGMIYVDRAGVESRTGLAKWAGAGVAFASSLPPKKPKK